MPAKSRAALQAELANLVPDNTQGSITPAFLRTVLANVIASAVFPEDGATGQVPVTPDSSPSDFSADFSADFGAAA